jgi:hypothetical protein
VGVLKFAFDLFSGSVFLTFDMFVARLAAGVSSCCSESVTGEKQNSIRVSSLVVDCDQDQ